MAQTTENLFTLAGEALADDDRMRFRAIVFLLSRLGGCVSRKTVIGG